MFLSVDEPDSFYQKGRLSTCSQVATSFTKLEIPASQPIFASLAIYLSKWVSPTGSFGITQKK